MLPWIHKPFASTISWKVFDFIIDDYGKLKLLNVICVVILDIFVYFKVLSCSIFICIPWNLFPINKFRIQIQFSLIVTRVSHNWNVVNIHVVIWLYWGNCFVSFGHEVVMVKLIKLRCLLLISFNE